MDILEGRKCDLCGAPATVMVRDVKEVEPPPGAADRRLKYREGGAAHFLCEKHKRPDAPVIIKGS